MKRATVSKQTSMASGTVTVNGKVIPIEIPMETEVTSVEETDSLKEGFARYLGKEVMVFCPVYIYTGILTGVNDKFVLLTNPKLVYDTGPFTKKEYTDAQKLPGEDCVIPTSSIETMCRGKDASQ